MTETLLPVLSVAVCVLAYGKPVCSRTGNVRAKHYGVPFTIAQQPYNSGLADALGHLVPCAAQAIRGDARGARLMHGELRVRVDVGVNTLELRQEILDTRFESTRQH
jgi:hypothetical protein